MTESADKEWIIIAYDLPNEPSKLRVRAWRTFKKLGAIYPSFSLCILPNTPQIRKEIDQIRSSFMKDGTILALNVGALESIDGKLLFRMFQDDRRRQYDEICEELQEFLDEIKENLRKKKITYEETDELEQAFEGLERWYCNIREKGYGRQEDVAKADKLMEECRKALTSFSEQAQPKEINR